MVDATIVGGGLAGSESAWQAAIRGLKVELYEMRPHVKTGAHIGSNLAELVCSNSLGSSLLDRASGLLKEELRRMGSLLILCAEKTSVPAGGALAVDRELFSRMVTSQIEDHPNISVIRQEIKHIPDKLTIVASGPLTSLDLSEDICRLTGEEHLYFYDAVSPIVSYESINFDVAFRASRYERGELEQGDYINCPMDRFEYEQFVEELIVAKRIDLHEFERDVDNGVRAGVDKYFESCLPIEIIAERGAKSLAFGPLKPIGINDPRTGRRPFAVVQLRQDNLAGSLYNLVGFQTNLKFSEQERVFRLIPGLENVEFIRYGQMHRNTFIHSPEHLLPTLQYITRRDLLFAGQITGVEGYVGNIATGLLAGWNAARIQQDMEALVLPKTTMLGALCYYITHAHPRDFQPMKANFGILEPLEEKGLKGNRARAQAYSQRAIRDLNEYLFAINSA